MICRLDNGARQPGDAMRRKLLIAQCHSHYQRIILPVDGCLGSTVGAVLGRARVWLESSAVQRGSAFDQEILLANATQAMRGGFCHDSVGVCTREYVRDQLVPVQRIQIAPFLTAFCAFGEQVPARLRRLWIKCKADAPVRRQPLDQQRAVCQLSGMERRQANRIHAIENLFQVIEQSQCLARDELIRSAFGRRVGGRCDVVCGWRLRQEPMT